jgi:two-component system LytT family sensor kinase
VLITIVENAFKHGDLKNQQAPIEINIDVQKNKVTFWCRNKKKSGPKELSTGVGLDNIRKRLDLAYGERYHFNIKDETEFYTTELTIDNL